MGIDVSALRERRREPDVSYWVQLLRQRYAGMKIVVGRDKLDEVQVGVFAMFLRRARKRELDYNGIDVIFFVLTLQGVRHKLEAFEQFLKKYPEYQGKVTISLI